MDLHAEVLCAHSLPTYHPRRNRTIQHSPYGPAGAMPRKPARPQIKATDVTTINSHSLCAQCSQPSPITRFPHTRANKPPGTHCPGPPATRPDVSTWHPRRSSHCPLPNASGRTGSLWCPPTSRRCPPIRKERPIHLHVCNTKTSNLRSASMHLPVPLHVEHKCN